MVWSKCIIAGDQDIQRARECVPVMFNDVWHSAVIDFGCVSSRIVWAKFMFSRVMVCVEVGYGPLLGGLNEWVQDKI